MDNWRCHTEVMRSPIYIWWRPISARGSCFHGLNEFSSKLSITALPLSWFWTHELARGRTHLFQLLTCVRWDLYSKTTISSARGRDNFKSSLQPPSFLSILYPQVLVQSYEFVWAVFFNRCSKLMVITITKSNKLRAAIAYLYCPAIGTSSAWLLQKLDKIKELTFCYFYSLYAKTYMLSAWSQRRVLRY